MSAAERDEASKSHQVPRATIISIFRHLFACLELSANYAPFSVDSWLNWLIDILKRVIGIIPAN